MFYYKKLLAMQCCVLKAQEALEVQLHAFLNSTLDVGAYMTSCRGHFNSGNGLPVPNGQKAGWTPKAGTQLHRRNEFICLAWNPATIFLMGQPENRSHLKIKARQDVTVHRPMPPIYDTRYCSPSNATNIRY